jgi:catechol 2,3-dioxygenase-like lactoylglutathione lyase family enzyme
MDDVGVQGIGQIAIHVADLERAKRFYGEVLGLPFLFQAGQLAFFDCGGVRLLLSRPERAEFDHPASIVYYRVADLDRSYAALRERGVAFRGDPHRIATLGSTEVWLAFLDDGEGNVLALISEKPTAV